MAGKHPVFGAVITAGGSVKLNRPDVCQSYCKGQFTEGDKVMVEIYKQSELKTNPQLGYWHSKICVWGARGLTEQTGERITPGMADKILSRMFLTRHRDTDIQYVESKKNIEAAEMTELIKQAIKFIAEFTGTVVPEPKKGWE